MANADRWADDAVLSRDLIALAMLTNGGEIERSSPQRTRANAGGAASGWQRVRGEPMMTAVVLDKHRSKSIPKTGTYEHRIEGNRCLHWRAT